MNLTTADVQRYTRVFLHFLAGYLVSHGFNEQASYITMGTGIAVEVVTMAWTIWGMRLQAKLNEMSQLADKSTAPVKGVILTNTQEGHSLAASTPGPVVVEGTIAATAVAKQNGH